MNPAHLHLALGDGPDRVVEVKLLPFGITQFAGPNEDMGQEAQRGQCGRMALIALNRAQQRANLRWRRDGGAMRHLRRNQRPAQIGGNIVVRPNGRDSIAENLTANAPQAVRGFVLSLRFKLAKQGQQFKRLDFSNRPMADRRIGKVEQPAVFLHRGWRKTFLLDLCKPLLRDGPECICRRDARRRLFQPSLLGWIAARRKQPPRVIALGSGSGEVNVGPNAEGQGLLFAKEAIVHSPVSATGRRYEQIEAARIAHLVLLVAALRRLDRYCRKSHEGISPSLLGTYPEIYPQISRVRRDTPASTGTIIAEKMGEISRFLDVAGRSRKEPWSG